MIVPGDKSKSHYVCVCGVCVGRCLRKTLKQNIRLLLSALFILYALCLRLQVNIKSGQSIIWRFQDQEALKTMITEVIGRSNSWDKSGRRMAATKDYHNLFIWKPLQIFHHKFFLNILWQVLRQSKVTNSLFDHHFSAAVYLDVARALLLILFLSVVTDVCSMYLNLPTLHRKQV